MKVKLCRYDMHAGGAGGGGCEKYLLASPHLGTHVLEHTQVKEGGVGKEHLKLVIS